MHTYRKSRDEELWTVGYWLERYHGPHAEQRWQPLSDHPSEEAAIWRVNFLNGGSRHDHIMLAALRAAAPHVPVEVQGQVIDAINLAVQWRG